MNIPPRQNVRLLARNVIPAQHAPGIKEAGKSALKLIQAFELYFTDEILNKIVDYTNEKIDQVRGKYSREHHAKTTNLVEIKAVIGLLYLAGVKKSSHVNLKDLWATDGWLGFELFRCVMSLPRFEFLLMFTKLVENFKKYYSLGHLVTLARNLRLLEVDAHFGNTSPTSRPGIRFG